MMNMKKRITTMQCFKVSVNCQILYKRTSQPDIFAVRPPFTE